MIAVTLRSTAFFPTHMCVCVCGCASSACYLIHARPTPLIILVIFPGIPADTQAHKVSLD